MTETFQRKAAEHIIFLGTTTANFDRQFAVDIAANAKWTSAIFSLICVCYRQIRHRFLDVYRREKKKLTNSRHEDCNPEEKDDIRREQEKFSLLAKAYKHKTGPQGLGDPRHGGSDDADDDDDGDNGSGGSRGAGP